MFKKVPSIMAAESTSDEAPHKNENSLTAPGSVKPVAPVPQSANFKLLRSVAIFSSLTEEELLDVELEMQTVSLPAGTLLVEAGQEIKGFLILKSGAVSVFDSQGERPRSLHKGELLGEETLFGMNSYAQAARAELASELLFYPMSYFRNDLRRFGRMAETVETLRESHDLAANINLPWLEQNEKILLLVRKHKLFLFSGALIPLAAFALIVLLATIFPFISARAATILLIIAFIGCGLWLLWNLHNWANDYYIISDRRMIWVEQVSGLYDSRQEAPLATLISTGVDISRAGAVLGYGDVVVRTFMGDIHFERVGHAEAIAKLIEAHWFSGKSNAKEMDEKAIREALRRKFDKPLQEVSASELKAEVQQTLEENEPEEDDYGFKSWLFSDFLKVRFETGDVIIYRKHWWVMIRRTLLPFTGILGSFGVLALTSSGDLTIFDHQMTVIVAIFFLLAMMGWWWYAYTDWKNDVFEITPTQIIDIDRKPFGQESRRVAPLTNVLSINYEKRGIIAMALDFGTVYISVGNQQLTFDDVHSPSTVQAEIFARMGTFEQQNKQEEADAEKERLAEWFRLYHDELVAQGLMGATPGNKTAANQPKLPG